MHKACSRSVFYPVVPPSDADTLAIRDVLHFCQTLTHRCVSIQRDERRNPFTVLDCPTCGAPIHLMLTPALSWNGLRCFVGFDDAEEPEVETEVITPAHFVFIRAHKDNSLSTLCAMDCLSPHTPDGLPTRRTWPNIDGARWRSIGA